MSEKSSNLKKLTVTGMLCAVAFLCVFLFKFKVSFLSFDLKDAFLAVISFLYGPVYGVFSAAAVAFLEFLSISDTGVYGLIMNIVSSAAFCGVCGLLYKYKHTFKGAIFGSVTAVLFMTSLMLVANLFITPFYMGVGRGEIAALIPALLLPFNIIKGTVNAALTLILYKPLTSALKRVGLVPVKNGSSSEKSFVGITFIAAAVILICIFILIFVLDGSLAA